jgi:hypothetical protein
MIDVIQKNVNDLGFLHRFLIFFFLTEGALYPISSIACAHISSTALQKSARVSS